MLPLHQFPQEQRRLFVTPHPLDYATPDTPSTPISKPRKSIEEVVDLLLVQTLRLVFFCAIGVAATVIAVYLIATTWNLIFEK